MHRKLTLMGKVTVIKTFAIPKLIYPFTVFENPNIKICNNLTTEIFKFIWDNKPDKIKRDILYQKYEYGGLKLTKIDNLINTVKAGWAKRYLDQNNKTLGKYSLI